MKKVFLILVILLLIQTFAKQDVCIIGGGASGMSSAVYLKDRGYNVVVLEKDDRVGGHCDTSYFTAPPGQQNWVELGVVVFPDTKKENDTGMGSWTVGSRQFAQRFLPADSTFPYNGGTPTYGFDFTFLFSTGLIPQNPPTPDFIAAFIRYNTILATQYPWVENANIPDPIPALLLRPFGEFIDANSLQPLSQLFQGLLMFGGMGNYRSVTTLYALQNLRRGVINVYTDPSYGFAIKGGCQKIYDGMVNYIESKNIFLNTNILSVRRYGTENIEIKYKQNYTNDINTINCKNIIISFPQLLTKLSFLDLTVEEIGIFSNVRANYYYNYRVDADGPITVGSPYTLASINILNPDTLLFPNILAIRRDSSFGPAGGYAYADTDIDEILMYNFVKLKLSLVPSSLLTNINVTVFDQHLYQAHFTNSYLAQTPSPYTRLNNLQGKKNTYWAGALFSFAETASIWQKTYDLVNQYFPAKK